MTEQKLCGTCRHAHELDSPTLRLQTQQKVFNCIFNPPSPIIVQTPKGPAVTGVNYPIVTEKFQACHQHVPRVDLVS